MLPFSGTGINQPILNVTTRDIVEAQFYHFDESTSYISLNRGTAREKCDVTAQP
jgi:hypothetical protein